MFIVSNLKMLMSSLLGIMNIGDLFFSGLPSLLLLWYTWKQSPWLHVKKWQKYLIVCSDCDSMYLVYTLFV